MNNAELPDTVLLQVILYSDIPSINNFRLTSRYVKTLIAAYEVSICNTVIQRTYSDYDIARFRPMGCSEPSVSLMIKLFNRVETASWLSGVLLEKHCDHITDCISPENECCNISAEDPRGDAVRARITTGWSILWHLADLAHIVETENRLRELDGNGDQDTRHEVLVNIELTIRSEWIRYAESLKLSERLAYHRIHFWLFPIVFKNPYVYDWGNRQDIPDSNIYHGALLWFHAHEGPSFFKEAWSSKEGNRQCAQRITAQWNAKRPELQQLCITTATDVSQALEVNEKELSLCEHDPTEHGYHDLVEENEEHSELMVGNFRDIPFYIVPMEIDTSRVEPLEYPEYLVCDSESQPSSSSSESVPFIWYWILLVYRAKENFAFLSSATGKLRQKKKEEKTIEHQTRLAWYQILLVLR